MTFLSCLGIGIAFAIAVGLLVFAGVLLGWVIPCPRGKRAGRVPTGRPGPRIEPDIGGSGRDEIDPPEPRA